MQAGEEMLRDKKGVHNSYKSPDSINAIDWSRKDLHPAVFDYYRRLIRLRNEHPAFRLNDAELVCRHLSFLDAPSNVVAFRLADHAGGDAWEDIIVVLNAKDTPVSVTIPEGNYEQEAVSLWLLVPLRFCTDKLCGLADAVFRLFLWGRGIAIRKKHYLCAQICVS